jgi:hypothetical protein
VRTRAHEKRPTEAVNAVPSHLPMSRQFGRGRPATFLALHQHHDAESASICEEVEMQPTEQSTCVCCAITSHNTTAQGRGLLDYDQQTAEAYTSVRSWVSTSANVKATNARPTSACNATHIAPSRTDRATQAALNGLGRAISHSRH